MLRNANALSLTDLEIGRLATLIGSREISPVEVVTAHLDRIAALDPQLHSFITVDGEGALDQARAAEQAISRGEIRGPLHGIPVAHKDNIEVRGLPTTAASRAHGRPVADRDAVAVGLLRTAGAITLGKTNLQEYASGDLGVYGRTVNPVLTGASPGGSSSGSGAALAAGLVPGATGTDTGGSVRNPAAFCGLVGLRPTFGRVSRRGVIPLSWSQDAMGPMARSVEDIAILLDGLSGQTGNGFRTRLRASTGITGLRFGAPQGFFTEDVHPEILGAVARVTGLLAEHGAHQVPFQVAGDAAAPIASWTIAYAESFSFHEQGFRDRPRDYTPAFLQKITAAGLLAASEYLTAARIRRYLTGEFARAFTTADIIVVPTSRVLPTVLSQRSPAPDGLLRWTDDFVSVTRFASLLGLPAVSVPLGSARDGSPLAVQLVGRPWSEDTLLRVARFVEDAVGKRLPASVPAPAWQAPETSEQISPAPVTPELARVLDECRDRGLDYVTEQDAAAMAPLLATVRSRLAEASATLPLDDIPVIYPAGRS